MSNEDKTTKRKSTDKYLLVVSQIKLHMKTNELYSSSNNSPVFCFDNVVKGNKQRTTHRLVHGSVANASIRPNAGSLCKALPWLPKSIFPQ